MRSPEVPVRARFGLLGDVVAAVDGAPIPLGHARQQCVLAALLVDVNRAVPVDQLIDRVWGEHAPQRARDTLYGYLYRLRRALTAAPDVQIARRSGGYLLAADPAAVDLHRFRRLVRAAHTATQDAERLALFDEALGLWRGEPFRGLDTVWLDGVRRELERERFTAELDRADIALRLGRHEQVVGELSRSAAEHPLNERLAGQLMLALHRAGRPAEALAHYRDVRAHLVDELGVEPGRQLQHLHRSLLATDPAPDPPAAAEPAGRPVPRQLPMPPRTFTGRSDDLARLDAALDRPDAVVITGAGGLGKTWLALHWAHLRLDRFPDGQLFVNLRGFDPTEQPLAPEAAVRGFLDALGVAPADLPADPAAQAGRYRSLVAGRRMLIVLDNARDADQVRPLLPGSPTCTVLVTSRSQMSGLVATEGIRPLRLGLLDPAQARHLLLQRLGPGPVTDHDAVSDIVASCAGLPLALAIVAARAVTRPTLSLRDLADELADDRRGLDALADRDAAADARSVFRASYRALRDPAAALFRLLALYPGPDIAAPALASLAGVSLRRLREPLDELTGAHLVAITAPGRYACHDLLRAYAAELLDPSERDGARRRLLDHYLHTAHAAALMIEPHRDPVDLPPPAAGVTVPRLDDAAQAQQWLDRERATLLAAVAQAASAGLDGHAWRLAWALATYLSRSCRWSELAAAGRTGLAAAQRSGDLAGQAHSHRDLGLAEHQLGRLDSWASHLHRAGTLFERLGDPAGQAYALLYLGWVYERHGRQRDALDCDERALHLFEKAGHTIGQARALNAIGWDHAQLGDHRRSIRCCRQALALHQALGDVTGAAKTWDSLGYAHHRSGATDEARACYRAALELYERAGERYGQAETLAHLGDHLHEAGEPEAARASWQQALDRLGEENPREVAQLRHKLGLPEATAPAHRTD